MFTVYGMSYGKHFSSMYTGSMVGRGAMVFAVWGYVVANMRPTDRRDNDSEMIVELNPKLLGPILGEDVKDVEKAIKFLCSPDAESRTQEAGGRRLKDLGAFLFLVVNGRTYWSIRNEEHRKEYLRVAQQKHRDKKLGARSGLPITGEGFLREGVDPGELADRVTDELAENRRERALKEEENGGGSGDAPAGTEEAL